MKNILKDLTKEIVINIIKLTNEYCKLKVLYGA